MSFAATILTLFPEMFPGPLGFSLAGDALKRGLWSCEASDIRIHGLGRHRAVDDTPAGGGPGMVMRADVLGAALDEIARVDDPLVDPFEARAQHHYARPRRPFARLRLAERRAARAHQQARARIGWNRIERGGEHIRAHHHAGAAAGGRIVHGAMAS